MPYLEHAGEHHELRPGENVIGSGSQAAWRVSNADLAPRHLAVDVQEAGIVRVRPQSAQLVVVVNGQQVPMAGVVLAEGDRVAAGSAVFTFYRDPATPPAPAPPLATPAGHLLDEAARAAYPLRTRTLTIGRDPANAVVVADPAVSRFHADVRGEAGEHVLYSTGAAGTRVNDARLEGPRILRDGDVLTVGALALRYTRSAPPAGYAVRTVDQAPEPSRAELERHLAPTGESRALPDPRRGYYVPYLAGAAAVIGALAYLLAR